MSIDLNALSPKELEALISQARKRKTVLAKRKPIAQVRSKITRLAKAEGYTIAELFGGAATRAPRPAGKPVSTKARKSGPQAGIKVAAKYRNPANPAETWSGRGMQPKWLAALTAKGHKLEDYLI